MEEEWKEIPDSGGRYAVSNLGRVRGPRGLMKPGTNTNGYRHVNVLLDGRRRTAKIHRLVAVAFVPGQQPGYDVCHNDGDKLNNRAGNLRWGTRSENILDQVSMGRHRSARKTHCAQGHEYTPENTSRWRPDSQRVCLTCRRARTAAYRARKRAERTRVA
jgi:hypothetical protein